MVRFLHTADVQLGMRALEASSVGERLRNVRFETLQRIIQCANEGSVDFVLIAGDLFENHQVSASTVTRAIQILSESAAPVYVLPGNHDWWDAGSVYRRPEFQSAWTDRIVILTDAQVREAPGDVLLYPCPITQRWSQEDPTAWIPHRESQDSIRIGVAHGTLFAPSGADRQFPVEVDIALERGLDFLALGHIHGVRLWPEKRMAYSGTPEPTRFGERDAGQVLIIEVEAPGAPPHITSHSVGSLCWEQWQEIVEDPLEDTLDHLRRRIRDRDDAANLLLRLELRGTVQVDDLPRLEAFEQEMVARCENGQLLYFEAERELSLREEVEGALQLLTERDPLIADVLADLRALAGSATAEDAARSRSLDELVQSFQATQPEGLAMSQVAQESLRWLAQLSAEVLS